MFDYVYLSKREIYANKNNLKSIKGSILRFIIKTLSCSFPCYYPPTVNPWEWFTSSGHWSLHPTDTELSQSGPPGLCDVSANTTETQTSPASLLGADGGNVELVSILHNIKLGKPAKIKKKHFFVTNVKPPLTLPLCVTKNHPLYLPEKHFLRGVKQDQNDQ